MRKLLGISFALLALAWATPSAAFDDGDYYLSCFSRVGGYYTGTGRGLTYYTYLKIADLRQLPQPEEKLQEIALSRFAEWAKATRQYGRWNSISPFDFDCYPTDVDVIERARAAWASSTDRDFQEIKLPPDWYKRSPSTASSAEIARYSTGAPAPGSDQPDSGSLTISAATPSVRPDWDEKVRESLRRDAAAHAKAIADAARDDAKTRVQIAKFFAELKKKGNSQ